MLLRRVESSGSQASLRLSFFLSNTYIDAVITASFCIFVIRQAFKGGYGL